MRTNDFIKAVKGLGLSVYEGSSDIVMVENDSDQTVVWVDTERMCVLDTIFRGFVGLDETIRKKLLALAVEYSTTPLEEREQEKRYRLKLNLPIIDFSEKNYLNIYKDGGEHFLNDKVEGDGYCTSFTETELKGMDETGFKRIPVEEEEK